MFGSKFASLGRTPGASIGSKATPIALQKAMGTASGSRQSLKAIANESTVQAADQRLLRAKANIHPGSAAGLKSSTSIHLQANNTGYLNPAHQNDRLKNRTTLIDTSIKRQNLIRNSYTNKISDSRLTSSNKSSISLLNKKIR